MPGPRRESGQLDQGSKMMIDAGAAAFKAARAKNLEGIRAVSEALSESCIACHRQYRSDYPQTKGNKVCRNVSNLSYLQS
jgi:hypothetical protein